MILRPNPTPRRGLSLLEVLVALAIFLFSLIGISQLVETGTQQAVELELRSEAALLAQSKMGEVIAGAVPLTSQSETPFDEDDQWKYTLDIQADDIPGLFKVKVVVSHDVPGGKVQITLSQYVLDPTKRGGTQGSTTETATVTP